MKIDLNKNFVLQSTRGFTLIELLVVVAIVGVLASIVLASLGGTRAKGADANIKANLAGIRSQAEIIYSSLGCYGADPLVATCTAFALAQCLNTAGTLFANPTVWGQITSAYTASGGIGNSRCYSSGSAWAVAVQLKTTDGVSPGGPNTDAWCVDSNGSSKAFAYGAGQGIQQAITTSCN